MDFEYYKEHIERRSVGKADLTPLYQNAAVFANLVRDIARPFEGAAFDKVAAPEALGFVLGGTIALRLEKGFVPVRKGGALPTLRRYVTRTTFVDYSKAKKSLEINKDLVKAGERVLVVDDWVETGAQMKAIIKLVERLEGEVIGISVLGAHRNRKTKSLFEKYNLHSIDIVQE